jgi:hypothetical protein
MDDCLVVVVRCCVVVVGKPKRGLRAVRSPAACTKILSPVCALCGDRGSQAYHRERLGCCNQGTINRREPFSKAGRPSFAHTLVVRFRGGLKERVKGVLNGTLPERQVVTGQRL